MKKVLGLDLGTNSIGWALIEKPEEKNEGGKILGMGSRIISLGKDKTNFEQGLGLTRNADRRTKRRERKLNKRYKQRRNKLIYILNELGILPDFIKWEGNFPDANKIQQLNILPIPKSCKQLNAFGLYELRKKAIYEKITMNEFGRLLYLFNQLRGYAGGETGDEDKKKIEDENENKDEFIKKHQTFVDKVNIISLKKIGTRKSRRKKDNNKEIPEYEVTIQKSDGEELIGITVLENLRVNEETELAITIRRNKTGEITSTEFTFPFKSSWRKQMEDLEKDLKEKGEPQLGEYFYEKLKEDKWYRVRSRVILRSRYKREFDAIWDEQVKHYDWLNNTSRATLEKIASFLFPGTSVNQQKYREEAIDKGLKHIIKEQIIYYQRPLKPQFKLIANCRYEKELKVIPQSHPLYQEYRIWQQINNLSINTVTEINGKRFYRDRELTVEEKNTLYELLQGQKELSHSSARNKLKLRDKVDYLNGLHIKAKLKGNETKITIKKVLGEELYRNLKIEEINNLIALWRILYNWIKKEYDEKGIENNDYEKNPSLYHEYDPNSDNEYDTNCERIKAIQSFIAQNNSNNSEYCSNEEFIKTIAKTRFKRAYGSLSEKAIKNLLPLMRTWNSDTTTGISEKIKQKIEKIKTGEVDNNIDISLREYCGRSNVLNEGGMISSYAAMLVYGSHTAEKISDSSAIQDYHEIKTFEQRKAADPNNADKYTLRNPVVEQLTNETLQIVKSIWKYYKIKPDEIRVELARELKNNADERNKIYKAVLNAEKENKRIKERLIELKHSLPSENTIELNENPSFSNIERYKLWSLQTREYSPDKKEVEKYKLWEEQKHISPYTMNPIPLSRLFTRDFEVDHIIPRSRFFDDSLANKVVCETSVNEDKGNRTAWEYITSGSTTQNILNEDDYVKHINEIFFGRKRKNLLLTTIPKDFVERQKKDTQYISIKVKEELGKIVGMEKVLTTTGAVTDYLRQHWGLNDQLKEITKDRFAAMGKICGEDWVSYELDEDKNKNVLKIKNWGKRFDHRHHAIDALVVACTEQSHIQRLNNLNKEFQAWLKEHKNLLTETSDSSEENLLEKFINLQKDKRQKVLKEMKESFTHFDLPWKDFPKHAEDKLSSMIVSHKPRKKLLIQKNPKDGKDFLRIRGGFHDETLYGKNESYRLPLSKLKGKTNLMNFFTEKVIQKHIAGELEKHLNKFGANAFTPEGIIEFNKFRIEKNEHPINAVKVRYSKDEGEGDEGRLQPLDRKNYPPNSIYVKTGDNYCFAIVEQNEKRKFSVLTFFDAVKLVKEEMKNGNKNLDQIIERYFTEICEETKNGKLLFILSQNDLVYLPKGEDEIIPFNEDDENFSDFWNKKIDKARIFRTVKMDAKQNLCYFVSHTLAEEIVYTPLKIEDLINDKEESVEKRTRYYEFGSYKDCSPYYFDNSYLENMLNKKKKKEMKKIREKEIDNLFSKHTDSIFVDGSKETDSLVDSLTKLVVDNIDLDLIKYIRGKDNAIAKLVKKLCDEKISNAKTKNNPKISKPIRIQDTCIKLTVDRLGNIKPVM
jgi:CRISPR/Cas system Type II protein with McrA/HNH and RuvC-like nuclease domain